MPELVKRPPVNELYALDGDNDMSTVSSKHGGDSDFDDLDDCIDAARENNGEMFSIVSHIRGHTQPKKKQKLKQLKPMAFVRFNIRHGKPKPLTIKALFDSGGSGTLVTEKYAMLEDTIIFVICMNLKVTIQSLANKTEASL